MLSLEESNEVLEKNMKMLTNRIFILEQLHDDMLSKKEVELLLKDLETQLKKYNNLDTFEKLTSDFDDRFVLGAIKYIKIILNKNV